MRRRIAAKQAEEHEVKKPNGPRPKAHLLLILAVLLFIPLVLTASQQNHMESHEVQFHSTGPSIALHVFAWRRKASLQRLMDSLAASDYRGHIVPLRVFVDGDASKTVLDYVNSITWKNGPLSIAVSSERKGLQEAIVSSWDASDDGEHVVFLEDDVEVSPLFFGYLLDTLYSDYIQNDPDVVGISLYNPKYNQILSSNTVFRPEELQSHMYRMQLPCSWGALYSPRHWRQFKDYYHLRTSNRVWVPNLPSSKSNGWERSWKRYYIEYMYLNGLTMLYPNSNTSFSTTHKEQGEHTGTKGKAQAPAEDAIREPRPFDRKHFIVPLATRPWTHTVQPLDMYPVLDLQHRVSTPMKLKSRGFHLVKSLVSTWNRDGLLHRVLGSRFLCLLDYSSSSPQCSVEEAYMVFEPQNGLTNQILALQDSIVLALATNRTLVIPPVVDPRGALHDAALFFHLDSLPYALSWITYASFEERAALDPRILPQRLAHRQQGHRFTAVHETLLSGIPHVSLGWHKYSPLELQTLFGGCSDTTLAFNNAYLLSSWRYTHKHLQLPDDLRYLPSWSDTVLDAANQVAATMQNSFNCIHLRRGDFEAYCSHIAKERASSRRSPYSSSRFKHFTIDNCYPSLQHVVQELQQSDVSETLPLYVATNEQNRSLLAETLGKMYSLVYLPDTSLAVPDVIYPAIEQAVCAQADLFIGNEWSTFSKRIQEKRKRHGLNSIALGIHT